MRTVSHAELDQKTEEYINFVKEFFENNKNDVYLEGKHAPFRFTIEGTEGYLDFNLGDANV